MHTFAPGVSDDHLYWRALVRMFWYRPGSSTKVQGRADHAPIHYEGNSASGRPTDACDGSD